MNPSDRRGDVSDPDLPLPGDVVAGKYEVERVLGAGGMGIVVAARHRQLGQRVAIKFMRGHMAQDASAVERFLREARAAVALSSEHVARVLDVGTLENGSPYMVLEHLSGVDLEQVVRRDGPMSSPAAVGIVLQASEAIAEAHSLGIVHRDLKPANIFLTVRMDGSRLVKVLDFGISKSAQAENAQNLTASGVAMGSPAYMSPEQVRSAKDVDARSDVWGLGVILHELLTGISPFLGESLGATFAKIVSESPPSVRASRPDVAPELAAIVDRCLQRKVEARVQSVAELASKLLPFGPKEAEISVERILRISGRARATAVAPPGTLVAPSAAPGTTPAPLGTDQAWLRSNEGTKRSSGPRYAIGAGVMVVVAGASGAFYHFRAAAPASASALPNLASPPAVMPAPPPAPIEILAPPAPLASTPPPEPVRASIDAGRAVSAGTAQDRGGPSLPAPKPLLPKVPPPAHVPPAASAKPHEIDIF